MDKAQILESNALIARFLGGDVAPIWKLENQPRDMAWQGPKALEFRMKYFKPVTRNGEVIGSAILAEHLQFHSDWNWLMEAVEKVERDFICRIIFTRDMDSLEDVEALSTQYGCWVEDDRGDVMVQESHQPDRITAAWLGVVGVLEQYWKPYNKR